MMDGMEFTAEGKKRIEREVLEVIIAALESDKLNAEDPSEIAQFLLARINSITNTEQLVDLLKEMTDKWPVFSVLLEQAKGQVQDRVDDEVADGVEMLIKQGKLERALALVKSITKKITPPY